MPHSAFDVRRNRKKTRGVDRPVSVVATRVTQALVVFATTFDLARFRAVGTVADDMGGNGFQQGIAPRFARNPRQQNR